MVETRKLAREKDGWPRMLPIKVSAMYRRMGRPNEDSVGMWMELVLRPGVLGGVLCEVVMETR